VTRHERIEAAEGRALVQLGSGSFWARLTEMFGVRRRGALRLLAVPRDPIAGDRDVGAELLQGTFRCGRHSYEVTAISPVEPDLPAEVAERLHSFAWLRDLAAAAPHARGAGVAERLARNWLETLPAKESGIAWRPDLWGRRILFWTAYAPYLLSSRDGEYRTHMLRLLARGAKFVERNGDRAPAGVPRIAAWSGAVAASLVFQGAAARLERAEAGLERALRSGLGDDGGLTSRTPFEQLDLVETLALLRAAYATTAQGFPDWLRDGQENAVSALLTVTMGDAALGSWQGGNPGDPHRVVAALEGAGAETGPLRQARGWGYQRLQAKDSVVILDAAPPPRAANGCASTLAFELSDGPRRLIVNCGGAGGARNALGDDLVPLLRSSAAHSTLTLGDTNSTAVQGSGGLGRGVEEVNVERGRRDGDLMVEADHNGYVRRFGLVHQRQLRLSADGKGLSGQDVLIPQGKGRRDANVAFAVRFHLAPGIEVIPTADGRGALLRARGAKPWQFKCRGGMLSIEESIWIDGAAVPHASQQLVIGGESPSDGMTISWELKRAG
jgi:uncharacterized heparinase superfamily protein